MLKQIVKVKWIALVSTLLLLAACGGGSDSTVVSDSGTPTKTVAGVAAAGAPLSGLVYLKDSAGTQRGPVAIAGNGDFNFDVTGLVAPFIIQAQGVAGATNYRLHTVAVGAGTANVNPLTEIASQAALGGDPEDTFTDPSTMASPAVVEAALAVAVEQIKTMLAPILTAFDANVANFITDSYAADSTGLDQVFDVIKVEIDNTAQTPVMTVTDKSTDTVIATADVAAGGDVTVTDNVAQTETDAVVAAKTEVEQIAAELGAFINAWKTASAQYIIDSDKIAATAAIDGYFAADPDFGENDGLTRDLYIDNEWVADASFALRITGVSNFAIVGKDTATPEKVFISFRVQLSDGSVDSPEEPFVVSNFGTAAAPKWQLVGNGHIAKVQFNVANHRHIYPEQTVDLAGLNVWIDNQGQKDIKTVTITGPGLPAAGVVQTVDLNDLTHIIAASNDLACARPAADGSCVERDWAPLYEVTDAAILTIADNADYIFVFAGATGSTLETRTITLLKRPWISTELVDTDYPTFTNITEHSMAFANNKLTDGRTFTYGYSLPVNSTNFVPSWRELELGYTITDGSQSYSWDKVYDEVASNTSSHTMTSPALVAGWSVVDNAKVSLLMGDIMKREIEVLWHFTDQVVTPPVTGGAASPIASSWGPGYNADGTILEITLYDNYSYVMYEKDTADAVGHTGVEYGTYTYDENTGRLTATPTFDANGEWGFSHPLQGWDDIVIIDPDTVTVDDTGVQANAITLNRLQDPNRPIVGSWGEGINVQGEVLDLTFYADGKYFHYEDGTDPNCIAGEEYGTYTYDSQTNILTATPDVDNNGQCGLSNLQQGDTLQINGDTLTFYDANGLAGTLARVQ